MSAGPGPDPICCYGPVPWRVVTRTVAPGPGWNRPSGGLPGPVGNTTRDSRRGGFRGRGCGGGYQPYRKYCHHWKMTNHNTKDCGKAPPDFESSSTPPKYCHHWKMTNHNTKDCGKAPPDFESSSTPPTYDSRRCYYCARQGHLEKDCRTKQAALELRKDKKTNSRKEKQELLFSASTSNDEY